MRGETVISSTSSVLPAATPVTVTAVPPAVTVKAAAGGRLADRSSENASWMVFPSAGTTALVSEGGTTNTSKTAESPYMGRVLVFVSLRLPLMGPSPVAEELGRPTRTPSPAGPPSATELTLKVASVPLSSQPVKG